jgi:hypothetical protein
MPKPLNILVFPCGSEVALEIYRSLEHSIHFNLIGANSVDDHGKFVFENYIGGVPFANHVDFIPSLKRIIIENEIDRLTATLPELKNFILPGATSQGAQAHIARCVCRRAERLVVHLSDIEEIK